MALFDLYNRIGIVQDLVPAVYKTTQTSTGIDRTAYEGGTDALVCALTVGAYTDGTHTFAMEDSPDNTNWTAVDAAYLQGSFTAISSSGQQNAVQKVGYIGTQRYVRVVDTVTGSPATGAQYGVNWIVSGAHYLPTGSPN
jgi:hypothetical protein